MYRIIKVLSNSGMLILDGDTGRELIPPGNRIGLGHRTGERSEQVKEAKWCELVTGKSTALQQVNSIDPVFIEAVENIIGSARKALGDISLDVLILMADHIVPAADRAREGRELPNPFSQDIKALFDRECQAAMEDREITCETTGIIIFEDKVGYIILHIHAGSSEENMAHSMDMARLVQNSIRSIEEEVGIKLVADSLGYNRLVSHPRYMIARIRREELMDLDMEAHVRDVFLGSYQAAVDVCGDMEKRLGMSVASQGVGFLAIHIQRVIQGEQERSGFTSEEAGSRSIYLPAF